MFDGSKHVEGIHYCETVSPEASLAAIRMILITSLMHYWHIKHIDFVIRTRTCSGGM